MKTMICSQCGAGLELTENKEFFVCPACGTKVYNDSLNKSLNFNGDIHIEEVNININTEKAHLSKIANKKAKALEYAYTMLIMGIITTVFAVGIFVLPLVLFWKYPEILWLPGTLSLLFLIPGLLLWVLGALGIKNNK